MERAYVSAKKKAVNSKLDYCLWFIPLRAGLIFVGYLYIFSDIICLIGIANDGYSPPITIVQEILIEDFVSKPVPVILYAAELGFGFVLLCAVYRRDPVLMQVFLYYSILDLIMSILVYSIIIMAVPIQVQLSIIFGTLFEIYVIILVRSGIVEIKLMKKQYELPTLVKSSFIQEKPTSSVAYTKNGLEEVKITELPKRQDVQLTILNRNLDDKLKEETKINDKNTTVINKDESKKVAEVKIEPEPQKKEEKKNKDEKNNKEDKKKKEEKKNKDDKKTKDEKKNKEDKKSKDEKKNKDDKKAKDEKKSIDDNKSKDEENAAKAKSGKDSNKVARDAWLQTLNEHPKE